MRHIFAICGCCGSWEGVGVGVEGVYKNRKGQVRVGGCVVSVFIVVVVFI